ncbi:hypothetical protein ACJMK2_039728 [Sinanodonta woodiana]|uniref:DOMON domain-containing protein n=1 Tax=Sinanodonta woodiana TaxID=1069815 RepID=A0ABD3WGW4_SINWO
MMSRHQMLTLILLSCLALARGFVGVNPTEPFNYSTEVDTNGNYLLFWKFNDTHITFEVHVKTYGYVAFGLSDNGKMYPADLVVGWVKDGVTHFKDYHTTAHAAPAVDKHQDWFLLHGEENDFGTVLKFVRNLDTCDKIEDKTIEDGTIRMIYAYHPKDPATDDSVMYHGPDHRGTKSLSLLSVSSAASVTSSSENQDVQIYDFLNGNFIIPSAATTYNCRVFRMPNIGGKRHMIKKHVHHILVHRCRGIDPKFDNSNYMCYDDIPKGLVPCYDVIIAWAIGGTTFYYPNHVGYSVGAPDDPDVYILETHYDNPAQTSGMIDNSGIRITLTKHLRPYEADMMEIGHDVNWTHIIPPFEKAYVSQSHCASQCIDHTLGNITEIKVFGIFQHAHLIGRNPHYDFDFQETRLLRKEIAVRRGDSLMVECLYDSSHRTQATMGGLSTRDEMCLSFIIYYPKVALKQCVSSPTFDSISNDQNRLFPLLSTYNWTTQHNRDQFKQKLKESSIIHVCQGDTMVPETVTYTFHENPPVHSYVPPKSSTCP